MGSIDSKKYKDFVLQETSLCDDSKNSNEFAPLRAFISSKNEIESVDVKFEQHLIEKHSRFLLKYFQKDGFSHKAIRAEFVQYIKADHALLFTKFCDTIE